MDHQIEQIDKIVGKYPVVRLLVTNDLNGVNVYINYFAGSMASIAVSSPVDLQTALKEAMNDFIDVFDAEDFDFEIPEAFYVTAALMNDAVDYSHDDAADYWYFDVDWTTMEA